MHVSRLNDDVEHHLRNAATSATRAPNNSAVLRSAAGGATSGPSSELACAMSPRQELKRSMSSTDCAEDKHAKAKHCLTGDVPGEPGFKDIGKLTHSIPAVRVHTPQHRHRNPERSSSLPVMARCAA